MKPGSREQEISNLLTFYEGDTQKRELYHHFSNIFNILHQRIVIIMTLCGAVVSVTGFSGRLIAQTNTAAQFCVIGGLMFCLTAAAIGVFFVLPVFWLSSIPADDFNKWINTVLDYRNRKTRAYRIALVFLLLGMTLYLSGVVIMLMFPHAAPPQISPR